MAIAHRGRLRQRSHRGVCSPPRGTFLAHISNASLGWAVNSSRRVPANPLYSERIEESWLAAAACAACSPALCARLDYGSEVHISQEQLRRFVRAAREIVTELLLAQDGILDLQRGRILLRR